VQIDGDVEHLVVQPPRDRQIVAEPRKAACLRDHQQRMICGLSRTMGAAPGSTTYVSCASGYRRRSARNSGVVSATSPMSRRRTTRILIVGGWWLLVGGSATNHQRPATNLSGSMVASSSQHDRESSLIGYNTVALSALERRAILTSFTGVLQLGHAGFRALGVDWHRPSGGTLGTIAF